MFAIPSESASARGPDSEGLSISSGLKNSSLQSNLSFCVIPGEGAAAFQLVGSPAYLTGSVLCNEFPRPSAEAGHGSLSEYSATSIETFRSGSPLIVDFSGILILIRSPPLSKEPKKGP